MTIRVLIADDHPVVCEGLVAIFAAESDIEVVAVAHDGREALELARQEQPHIALLDLRMPRLDGAEVALVMQNESPRTGVIMLTSYGGDEDIHRSLSAGARAYLLKGSPASHVIDVVRTVHGGGRVLPQEISQRLMNRYESDELTTREIEVLRLMVTGQRNKEIAASSASRKARSKAT